MPVRHSKRDGKFLGAGASPSMASTTHTSSGVTGSFKTYPKAAPAAPAKRSPRRSGATAYEKFAASNTSGNPLLPQLNAQGVPTTLNASTGKRITRADSAALMFGRGSKKHKQAQRMDAEAARRAQAGAKKSTTAGRSTSNSRKAAGRK